MPAGYSLEQVSTIGVVLEASESNLARMPFAVLEELSEQLKEATNGAAVYLGVYRNRSQSEGVRLRLICSSYQLPDGILAMVNDARREGGILRDKLQQTLSPLELGEIEDFDLFRTSLRTGAAQKGPKRQSLVPGLSDDGFDMPTNVRAPRRSNVSARPVAPVVAPVPSEASSASQTESDLEDDDGMVDARPTPVPGSTKRDLA